MPIKVVLFDLFDTLIIIRKNSKSYSPSLMRMYKYLNGNGINVSFGTFQKAYVKSRDELFAKADANLEEPHFNVRVSETLKSLGYNHEVSSPIVTSATAEFCEEFLTQVFLDRNTKKLLKTLHGKYKLGIISNFALPECVDKLLKTYDLNQLFDAIVVSGAVNKRKPCPEIFEHTLKTLGGTAASETVFVGDTLDSDIEGAKAVGMKAVYLQRRIEKVEQVPADLTIKSLSELPRALRHFQKSAELN
jgi:putative hydrolase of the HAD superfamily